MHTDGVKRAAVEFRSVTWFETCCSSSAAASGRA